MDVLCVLAVPDYLVRKSARRNDLVRGAEPWRLGCDRLGDCDSAIRFSIPGAAIARFEKERREVGIAGGGDPGDARGRCDLVDRAGISSGTISFELDGHCGADRDWRIVAG